MSDYRTPFHYSVGDTAMHEGFREDCLKCKQPTTAAPAERPVCGVCADTGLMEVQVPCALCTPNPDDDHYREVVDSSDDGADSRPGSTGMITEGAREPAPADMGMDLISGEIARRLAKERDDALEALAEAQAERELIVKSWKAEELLWREREHEYLIKQQQMQAGAEELCEKLARWREALRKYGQHRYYDCLYEMVGGKPRHRGPITECKCGLAQALSDQPPVAPKGEERKP